MIVVEVLFWASLAAILWTHVGYPLAAALLARVHTRHVRKADVTPSVTVIIPAHDEDGVIGARLDNLLALDYPHEQLEIVVASDASTDGTDAIVESYAARDPRIRLLRFPRGGKLAALNRAVSEARATSSRSRMRTRSGSPTRCASSSATSPTTTSRTSAGAASSARTGRTARASTGATSSGCARASRVSARSPAATARSSRSAATEYVAHRFGLDLGLPARWSRRGCARCTSRRPSRREAAGQRGGGIPPQGAHVPLGVAAHVPGPDARRRRPAVPLRARSRTACSATRAGCCTSSCSRRSRCSATASSTRSCSRVSSHGSRSPRSGGCAFALPGAGLAYYYFLVTWATIAALVSYLRFGVSPHWERAEGAR